MTEMAQGPSMLEFQVSSGGTITIDLTRCTQCASKACLKVCQEQGGPLVPDGERGLPTLRWSAAEVQKGGCVECLGCELDCELYGQRAIKITLPLPGFEEYLQTLHEPPVYQR